MNEENGFVRLKPAQPDPPAREAAAPGCSGLGDVLREERAEIARRRDAADPSGRPLTGDDVADDLVGLCLSGGGIRSATFNLGLFQALHASGLLKHIDYLVTISGGGYIGANLALHASESAAPPKEETKAPDKPGRAPSWFPYPLAGDGSGKQVEDLQRFYIRGDYLNRPVAFAFSWLPGLVLNLVIIFLMLTAICSGLALLFRVLDDPWSDWAMREVFMDVTQGILIPWIHRALWVAFTICLGLAIICWLVRNRASRESVGRLQRTATLSALAAFLLAIGGIVPVLEWPRSGEDPRASHTSPIIPDEVFRRIPPEAWGPALQRVDLLQGNFVPRAWANRDYEEAWFWSGLLLDLLWSDLKDEQATDPGRVRDALAILKGRAKDLGKETQADPGQGRRGPRGAAYDAQRRSLLDFDIEHSPDDAIQAELQEVLPLALALFDEAFRKLPFADPDTSRPLDPAAIQAMEKAILYGHLGIDAVAPGALSTEQGLGDYLHRLQMRQRAQEITNLVITDLFRAMLPALVAGFLAVVLRVILNPKNDSRRTTRLVDGLFRLTWLLLMLGLLISLSNGDTDIGLLKYLLPHVSDVETVVDPTTGVVSGARLTLSGTLATVRDLFIIVPTGFTVVMALIPLFFRDKFLKTGEQPKESMQGRFFRFVLGSIVVVLPLFWFTFFVRENVSGAAPLKAKPAAAPAPPAVATAGPTTPPLVDVDEAAPANAKRPGPEAARPEARPKREVARMAFCSGTNALLDRAYLIQNDQLSRLMTFVGSLGGLLVVGLLFDLNHTSMHGFYRDRLYEAYLAREPGERHRDRKLDKLDGTAVGFPYHIIATTLNQFHHGDTRRRSQHNFILSPRYCGSEPTGYCRTDQYRHGVRLADAVAISGAAISPLQGRTVAVQFLMLVLNMRLGQWYPNPNPAYRWPAWARPCLLTLLYEHKYLLFGPKRPPARPAAAVPQPEAPDAAPIVTPDETRPFCFLSDGAHYDNLGIELILERRPKLVLISDVSRDPRYEMGEFVSVLRQLRVREGYRFEPIPMDEVRRRLEIERVPIESILDARLHAFSVINERTGGASIDGSRLTADNFLVVRVTYPTKPRPGDIPRGPRVGILILVKPSLTQELIQNDPVLFHHARSFEAFPHDNDLEQVYDAPRIEAYRQLGQCVGEVLGRSLFSVRMGEVPSRDELFSAVEKLCQPDPRPPGLVSVETE